mmetsp:Transcript_18051/g.34482  ORF Transcript_18051/g.34482 Transcript_18051/m.34482 type:complete len:206 (+) Transcript_18051:1664-2281(+)
MQVLVCIFVKGTWRRRTRHVPRQKPNGRGSKYTPRLVWSETGQRRGSRPTMDNNVPCAKLQSSGAKGVFICIACAALIFATSVGRNCSIHFMELIIAGRDSSNQSRRTSGYGIHHPYLCYHPAHIHDIMTSSPFIRSAWWTCDSSDYWMLVLSNCPIPDSMYSYPNWVPYSRSDIVQSRAIAASRRCRRAPKLSKNMVSVILSKV